MRDSLQMVDLGLLISGLSVCTCSICRAKTSQWRLQPAADVTRMVPKTADCIFFYCIKSVAELRNVGDA